MKQSFETNLRLEAEELARKLFLLERLVFERNRGEKEKSKYTRRELTHCAEKTGS